jgi:aminopeptidase
MSKVVERWHDLAELTVHGANIQPGQVVAVTAEHGQAKLARAIAVAAYSRGARFVDVVYHDTRIKQARIANADPDTLEFVPPWYGKRLLELADGGGARIALAGISTPPLYDGLDPALVGRDRLPWLAESAKVLTDRSTNWCIVPCPHPEWARVAYPDLPAAEAYERLWRELAHVMRLDEPDPKAAWDERLATLRSRAEALTELHFRTIELRGPGTDLRIGLLPSARWDIADAERRDGLRHLPNLPTEEIFTSPDPERTEGFVASTRPLVLRSGPTIRNLRVRFQAGRATELEADENAAALRAALAVDSDALRLGELALVDSSGRIGPLGTVFCDTLLDENAESHLAFGNGFHALVGDADRGRVNTSLQHIDFMIGSRVLEVDGITVGGDCTPILRGGEWQIPASRRCNGA